jgi:FKBP-type peptidyl-prolyl cis-trans isomerase
VQVGDIVTVNFEVRAENGKPLAGTLERGLPYSFVFGDDRQPKMWADALHGLKVGGERWCVVPPEKGFGRSGVPLVVPPDAVLYIHVWVVAVRGAPR